VASEGLASLVGVGDATRASAALEVRLLSRKRLLPTQPAATTRSRMRPAMSSGGVEEVRR
jgi:hypothetical protein